MTKGVNTFHICVRFIHIIIYLDKNGMKTIPLPKIGFMQLLSSLVLYRMCRKCGVNLHEHKILIRMDRKRTVIAISASGG